MSNDYLGPKRRETDTMKELPVWAQVVMQIIFKYGIISAIAVFLIYIGAKEVPLIRSELQAHRSETLIFKEVQQEIKIQNEYIYRMMQRICYNTARTDMEKNLCFQK